MRGKPRSQLALFDGSMKVGNHPYTLQLAAQKRKDKAARSSSSVLSDDVLSDDGVMEWWEEMLKTKSINKALLEVTEFEKEDLDDELNRIKALKHLEHSGKMVLLMQLIDGALAVDEKILVFSQSIPTLDYIQDVLMQKTLPSKKNGKPKTWKKGIHFQRLDGSILGQERQGICDDFKSRKTISVMLLSTKATRFNITALRLVLSI
jgi:SNF2 family DNA or RNA helicase